MRNNSISLEMLVSGFNGPELIVIGSRPSMGKTFLALTLAVDMVFDRKKPVAFFSLELSKDILLQRLSKIRDLDMNNIHNLPLYIFDTPQMIYSELEQCTRNIYNEKNIKAVFIDYIGLLLSSNTTETLKDEQAVLIGKLKNLAKELNIPIIVILPLLRDNKEAALHKVQSQISSDEAFQSIDKLLLIQKTDTCKSKLTVYKHSQHNEWANEEIEWTLPAMETI